MKKISVLLVVFLIICGTACRSETQNSSEIASNEEIVTQASSKATENDNSTHKYEEYASMTAEEIASRLSLEQKAAQMVQPAVYCVTPEDMAENCYGSILSKTESLTYVQWQELVNEYQQGAVNSEAGIPFIYGQDDVHGVNYCSGAVIYPHNIGIGAANNPELTYKMGLATADEAKLCNMLWNFAPCVAQSEDPRWGRTYETYSSDTEIIKSLSGAYTKGLIDGGIVACGKHFFGDGNVVFGTGEKSDVDRIIDRGDAVLTDDEIKEQLSVYQNLIDNGVQTIMISHSSLNGTKMHENVGYIQYLKNEMGFEGFIVSDWDSVKNTSPSTYEEQVITSVNAGIDMLMEVETFEEARQIIIEAVKDDKILQERVDDAVTRIIQVKLDAGVFEDPFCENIQTKQAKTGSDEYRQLAESLVEQSLVLLKNDNNILPLQKDIKVYVTGPAADNESVQCGGWTIDWNESPSNYIQGVTTILDGFTQKADDMGITAITDPGEAEKADVVLLVVGEKAYAEWNGDTEDLCLCGELGLDGNIEAIEEAKALGKPTVTCIVAGRNVIIDEYEDNWDSIVMCYLPGSEGQGVADVLLGNENFSGKLPAPWYSSAEQIGTDECKYEQGYGLAYLICHIPTEE